MVDVSPIYPLTIQYYIMVNLKCPRDVEFVSTQFKSPKSLIHFVEITLQNSHPNDLIDKHDYEIVIYSLK